MSNTRETKYVFDASAEVQYSFVCEKCGAFSGRLTHVLNKELWYKCYYRKRLTVEELIPLCEKAQQNLDLEIEKLKHDYYYPYNDYCQCCGGNQSWAKAKRQIDTFQKRSLWLLFFNILLWLIMCVSIAPKTNWGIGIVVLSLYILGWPMYLSPVIFSYYKKRGKYDSAPSVYWDTLGETELKINIIETGSWGAKKEYPVNIHEVNREETEETNVDLQ